MRLGQDVRTFELCPSPQPQSSFLSICRAKSANTANPFLRLRLAE